MRYIVVMLDATNLPPEAWDSAKETLRVSAPTLGQVQALAEVLVQTLQEAGYRVEHPESGGGYADAYSPDGDMFIIEIQEE